MVGRRMARVLVAAVLATVALGVLGVPAHAQYIPELPTTTVGDGGVVRSDDVARGSGGAGSDLPVTGSDLTWLGRFGAGLLVLGGLVLMAPARRRRAREGQAGTTQA